MIKSFLKILRKLLLPTPTTQAARIGAMGENAAANFLKQKGMKILTRNYKSGRNEIDIVCKDADVLVFVEVKTRKANARVNGYFAGIQKRKIRAVKSASKDYMRALKNRSRTWRFDVVEVQYSSLKNLELDIRHFENVY